MDSMHKVVDFDEMKHVVEDELETPRKQLRSADPRGVGRPTPSVPASSRFLLSPRYPSRRVLRRWTLNPNFVALVYNEFDASPLGRPYIYTPEGVLYMESNRSVNKPISMYIQAS
jgi:hypothetical protein